MQSTLRSDQNISLITTNPNKPQILVYWKEYHDGQFDKLLVFGPNYRAKDSLFWKERKKEALEHVLKNSECSFPELKNAIGSAEKEAREAYATEVVNNISSSEFQKMMAEDGCLFLLLSLSILGADTQLKFREDHLVFGIGCAIEEMTTRLRSMFLVGNQVPFAVLEKLMELRFFQELKERKQWKQPLELAKRTLYKFLMGCEKPYPVDLIHCLQRIMLGTTSGSTGAIPGMPDDMSGIPSAWQLYEHGVRFEKLEGELGSRRIHFKCSTLNAVLYLPVFRVDMHTDLMIDCLRKYESIQEYRGLEPEASSYFELLNDLIRTPQDLEVLSSSGIIQGQLEELSRLLRTFDCRVASSHLCQVRKQISEEAPLQWRKFLKLIVKFIVVLSSCLMILFTYIQAEYTVLGYYKKGK